MPSLATLHSISERLVDIPREWRATLTWLRGATVAFTVRRAHAVTAASRRVLCCLLSALIAIAPVQSAFAVETAEPAESFTFADGTPAARFAIDKTNRQAASGRKVPVSSSGAYTRTAALMYPQAFAG